MSASAQQRIVNLASQNFLHGFPPDWSFAHAARQVSTSPAAWQFARKVWDSHWPKLATKWLMRTNTNRMPRN